VSTGFEGGPDVRGGRFSGVAVERRGFEQDVSRGGAQPFSNAVQVRAFVRWWHAITELIEVEAAELGKPSHATAGDAGDAEVDGVLVAQDLALRAQ
jgi:hypothetical protein